MDLQTIKHIAKLSYLEFSEEEMARFAEELSAIVDYVSELEKAPTEGNPRTQRAEPRLGKSLAGLRFVRQSQSSWTKREQSSYDGVPASFVPHTSARNVFRSDNEPSKENLEAVEALLGAAPEREDGYVKVKAVL